MCAMRAMNSYLSPCARVHAYAYARAHARETYFLLGFTMMIISLFITFLLCCLLCSILMEHMEHMLI